MDREQAMSRLLELCPHADELTVDRVLDNAVILGRGEVGGYNVTWDRENGFVLPPARENGFVLSPAAASDMSLHASRHSAAELAGHVPGLLGFRPERSVVVIGTAADGQVTVTLRYDLPDRPSPSAAEMADHAAGVLEGSGARAATVISYGPAVAAAVAAAAFRERLARAPLRLTGVLRSEDGTRCWCLCGQPGCDPAAPIPVPSPDPLQTAARQILSSRATLAATIAPMPGPAADAAARDIQVVKAHAAALTRQELFERGCAAAGDAITAYRAAGPAISGPALAWLAVPLTFRPVRDVAWASMDPEFAQAHQRLWTDVIRLVPSRYRAAPASLLAFTAWQQGNGALANVALDRALEADSGYSMARLLQQVIASGAPPALARLPMSLQDVAASYGLPAPHPLAPAITAPPTPGRQAAGSPASRTRSPGLTPHELEGP